MQYLTESLFTFTLPGLNIPGALPIVNHGEKSVKPVAIKNTNLRIQDMLRRDKFSAASLQNSQVIPASQLSGKMLFKPSQIDAIFETESESWSSDPKAPLSWVYSLDKSDSADPYYKDREAKSWKCERPRVQGIATKVKDKLGNWIDKKYREGKPDGYFKNL